MNLPNQQLLDHCVALLVVGTAALIIVLYILQGNYDWNLWSASTDPAPVRDGISALPWH